MSRKIEIELDDILSLVSCATDYGFEDDVLFSSFKNIIKTLSEDDIESHCIWYLSDEGKEQGYGEEDYDSIKETLLEFKEQYFK